MQSDNLQSDLYPLYKPLPPFMNFEGGHGYVGVILQSAKTGKIQCHLCGGMYKNVARHAQHVHDIDDYDYRELVGLNKTTPLVCESTSYKLREAYQRLPEAKKAKRNALLVKNNKEVHQKGLYRKRPNSFRTQQKNLFGTCDLQAKHLFWVEYKKQKGIPDLRTTPRLKHLVYTRFNSYRDALKTWGINEAEIVAYENQKQVKAYEARKAKGFFPKYDVKDIMTQLNHFYAEHNRLPTWVEAERIWLPSRVVFKRVFGTAVKSELYKKLGYEMQRN